MFGFKLELLDPLTTTLMLLLPLLRMLNAGVRHRARTLRLPSAALPLCVLLRALLLHFATFLMLCVLLVRHRCCWLPGWAPPERWV